MNIKFCDSYKRWNGEKRTHGNGRDLFLRKRIHIIRDKSVFILFYFIFKPETLFDIFRDYVILAKAEC